MVKKTRGTAGGRATEAGMSFQAGVGAWLAAHIVCGVPIGPRFGMPGGATPVEVRFETGEFLDDTAVRQSDDGLIMMQCKTHPNLSPSPGSDLASTIAQLVSLVASVRHRPEFLTGLERTAAVLAVARDAARSLDDLESACRYFDHGATWDEAPGALNQSRRRALGLFAAHARRAWLEVTGEPAPDHLLASLARLFRVVRFDVSGSGADRRDTARLIGQHLLGDEGAGQQAHGMVLGIVRDLIANGAPAGREGLMRALRSAGLQDSRSPGYDGDVARLRQHAGAEVSRLRRHGSIPAQGGTLPIRRACAAALRAAVGGGHLLIVGEPGAGKTGALVALAEEDLTGDAPSLLLSAERLAGVTTAHSMQQELGLEHPVLDVLAAWPGTAPGTIFVDALDSSRGGPSELVLAGLIEDVVARLGDRWTVVASIRTFDLLNGTRFRNLVRGPPPSAEFSERGLDQVRHFRIPRLAAGELAQIAAADPGLGQLVECAPAAVRDLLGNAFNLSLAADLVAGGMLAESMRTIASQSDLIDRYEEERLPSHRLKGAVRDAVAVMVERRRLSVPQMLVRNDAIDEVLALGVMVAAGDRISFAHHVLFDHAASRFHLEWGDVQRLRGQVGDVPTSGLFLGPSVRFALERVWRDDKAGRQRTWHLVAGMAGAGTADPVMVSIALRTVAERVAGPDDIAGLCALVRAGSGSPEFGATLSRLARYVGMSLGAAGSAAGPVAAAWAMVAHAAVAAEDPGLIDAARYLLSCLAEQAGPGQPFLPAAYGAAARALLERAIKAREPMPGLVPSAIRFVCRSFPSDPGASRSLLEQLFEEPRFSEHAHEEAMWLAEGVRIIAQHDPDFAVRIYEVLYGRPAPQEGSVWLGGRPSRILPLSTDRRQNYHQARWTLARELPAFLDAWPAAATRAASAAIIGMSAEMRRPERADVPEAAAAAGAPMIVEDDLSMIEWRDGTPAGGGNDILAAYSGFVARCTPEQFREATEAALGDATAASVWVRILQAGSGRDEQHDLLWLVASGPTFLASRGIVRHAVAFLAAAYPSRTPDKRASFEVALVAACRSADEAEAGPARDAAARLLSVTAEELLGPDLRRLKRAFEPDGALAGNPPLISIGSEWGPIADIEDLLLRQDGVDLELGPDRELISTIRSLDRVLQAGGDGQAVAEAWKAAAGVAAAINGPANGAPHASVLLAARTSACSAVERIAGSAAFSPGERGHPNLPQLIDLIDRLAFDPAPTPNGGDARLRAAAALIILARHRADRDGAIASRLARLLRDPVAAVRAQAAQSLDVLWAGPRDAMWEMAEVVAREEDDARVLALFVGGTLTILSGPEPGRCEALASAILARQAELPSQEEGRDGLLEEAFGNLAARLLLRGTAGPPRWTDAWLADLVRGQAYLSHLLRALRPALFAGLGAMEWPDAAAARQRARDVLHRAAAAASLAMSGAKATMLDTRAEEATLRAARGLYVAGEALLGDAGSQIYFGSGAFEHGGGEPPGLAGEDKMRKFLDEYAVVLDLIGRAGTPRVIHQLLGTYQHLAAAATEAVFDRVSDLLVGPAALEGYHFESLASDLLARIVQWYLADHRAVFEDEARRAKLMRVLELFSGAGWPEPLRLLFDLPELLR